MSFQVKTTRVGSWLLLPRLNRFSYWAAKSGIQLWCCHSVSRGAPVVSHCFVPVACGSVIPHGLWALGVWVKICPRGGVPVLLSTSVAQVQFSSSIVHYSRLSHHISGPSTKPPFALPRMLRHHSAATPKMCSCSVILMIF